MDRYISSLSDKPYATTVDTVRLDFNEFKERMLKYLEAIRDTSPDLRQFENIFCSGARVWPSECTRVIQDLKHTGEHYRNLLSFIEASTHLPLVVVPLRLSLLLALKNVELQITRIDQLLVSLLNDGCTALNQPAEQRHAIEKELAVLLEHGERVVLLTEQLLDIARFKRRAVTSV